MQRIPPRSYSHLHALALQVPEGHPGKPCLLQNLFVQVIELVELIRFSSLWVEEHIGGHRFRQALQQMRGFVVECQQPLASENVPIADMKIGPR